MDYDKDFERERGDLLKLRISDILKQTLSIIIIDLVEVILRLMFEIAIYLINVLFVIFYISIKIE